MSGVAEVIEFEVVMSTFVTWHSHRTTFISDFWSFFDISFAGSKVSGVAEVIEFEIVMSIFVNLIEHLLLVTFCHFFAICFAGSKVSGVAEVIEFEVAMSIFITLGPSLTTFINKTFFRFLLPYWIQSGRNGRSDRL
jgi:hypothetical protein